MKFLKYVAVLALVAGLLSSCKKEDPFLEIGVDSVSLESDTQKLGVYVTTNVDLTIDLTVDWLTFASRVENTVTFNVATNTDPAPRETVVIFRTKDSSIVRQMHVHQAGASN